MFNQGCLLNFQFSGSTAEGEDLNDNKRPIRQIQTNSDYGTFHKTVILDSAKVKMTEEKKQTGVLAD